MLLSQCLSMYVYIYIYLFKYLYLYLSIDRSIDLSIYLSIYISISVSISLSRSQSPHVSVSVSVSVLRLWAPLSLPQCLSTSLQWSTPLGMTLFRDSDNQPKRANNRQIPILSELWLIILDSDMHACKPQMNLLFWPLLAFLTFCFWEYAPNLKWTHTVASGAPAILFVSLFIALLEMSLHTHTHTSCACSSPNYLSTSPLRLTTTPTNIYLSI